MSQDSLTQDYKSQDDTTAPKIDASDAKQGTEEHTVRYILTISICLAVIGLLGAAYVYV